MWDGLPGKWQDFVRCCCHNYNKNNDILHVTGQEYLQLSCYNFSGIWLPLPWRARLPTKYIDHHSGRYVPMSSTAIILMLHQNWKKSYQNGGLILTLFWSYNNHHWLHVHGILSQLIINIAPQVSICWISLVHCRHVSGRHFELYCPEKFSFTTALNLRTLPIIYDHLFV
jgi:hypothetical protein